MMNATPAQSPNRSITGNRIWLLLAILVVAVAWLTTMQIDIGASNGLTPDTTGLVGPLMDDSGEFVVAWHTWGVTHAPGYPLLNFIGNLATRLFGILPLTPVAAASLVSFSAGIMALAILVLGIIRETPLAAAAAVFLVAFSGMIWLYSSVAEVYAFGLLLAMGLVVFALAVGRNPRPTTLLLFGSLFGLAVGHHRTLLALTPALAVALWPARALGWRPWLGAGLLAILSLAVYIYLPLAAWSGSPWIYGRSPATWAGFMDAVLAREYQTQIAPPTTWPAIADALTGRLSFLALEMTLPALILGFTGLIIAVYHPTTRRTATVLGLVFAGYLFAPVGQYLLIGTHMLIMVAALALAGCWALGIAAAGKREPAALWLGLGLSLVVAAHAWQLHRPWVLGYTRDPLGRQIINAAANLPAIDQPPTVVETWGPRFFALAYGKWVSGELSHVDLINVRQNLRGLPPAEQLPPTIYTTRDMLYLTGLAQWETHLNKVVSLESAGDGLITIRCAPRLGPTPVAAAETEVILREGQVWSEPGGDLRIRLDWQAVTRPTTDYHVFVHVTDQAEISGADDILAQGDRQHPVYGFYPTSRWIPGELVRDDFRIPIPAGRQPRKVFVGLYTVSADGEFTNHLRQELSLP